jgi:hypothetical protein
MARVMYVCTRNVTSGKGMRNNIHLVKLVWSAFGNAINVAMHATMFFASQMRL